ncbi:nuclear transport factor 2-like protein [Chryseobacterium paridis]|uniref:Nuclear transport factor 2 family protein n=1 Tax=Chryseobacterium paridis TaxID=2800328 RepID=A0ABS1FY87_9FLAO|nr:nuclear transport factor 2 family protein [Chryseobacterium paridis]MBK1897154.1 nuclear transport factor 2 family protein [Chryseobacterium paridis]
MRKIPYLLIIFSMCSACAQKNDSKKLTETQQQTKNNMDTTKLNETVKKAFDAWQSGDAETFTSFFTGDAKLYDDGNPRDFKKFIKDACGHEKFTSIDKIENDGKTIYGQFHTESWGDFKTFFKFNINSEGKFDTLEIGQAN